MSMGGFEELGRRLDKLAEGIKAATQSGVEKTTGEAKDWREKLDELGDRIKKTTQEGIERFTTETKEFSQITRLRSQIRQGKKEIENMFRQMGEKTYELHLQKKIGHVELKKLGAEVTRLRKDIEAKERQIQSLRGKKPQVG
jgi:chromosome segregation ATPase